MRKLALSVAAILVLAVASPAFAQPFADVPTDHWAFDAIAELAAKGIIEGFPDGTFKGDRGVTRYEVAMIVARILARIEAIKIPGPAAPAPAPQVTRADVQTIQRLVNEFRAELAALGVRVTAVEEELTALKGSADAFKITADTLIEYVASSGGSGSVNQRHRVTLTGKNGPWTFVGQLCLSEGGNCDADLTSPYDVAPATFRQAYVDWGAGVFGTTWRVGRQIYSLGPNGLLFNSGETAADIVDGAKVGGSFGPLSLTAGFFVGPVLAASTNAFPAATDVWTLAAGFDLLPGWTTNVYYLREQPLGGTSSSGYEAAFSGDLMPGVSFAADYASYQGTAATTTGWRAGFTVDLGGMMGMAGTTLELVYKDYGPGAYATGNGPGMSNAETTIYSANVWDLRSYYARLDVTLNPAWAAHAAYETGELKSTGDDITEYEVGVTYQLGGGAALDVYYDHRDAAGVAGGADAGTYYVDYTISW